MSRLRRLPGVLVIAAILLGQSGCQYLIGKAAMEVGKEAGKKVYKKLKNDDSKGEKQPTSQPERD